MSFRDSILRLFGWRADTPNIADKGSRESIAVARAVFDSLGVRRDSTEAGQTLGSRFEGEVRAYLSGELTRLDSRRRWIVGSQPIVEFAQYAHLARVKHLLEENDPAGTLRTELGMDYIIKPDVTVGILEDDDLPFLHAAVSCKWTIRSDRVQNIRHEGVILTRHRRGRQPHVVTVTAEPQASRLAAIARGTGEVDCVYHAVLDQLVEATNAVGGSEQVSVLRELIEQHRLRPIDALPEVLARR